MSENWRKCIKCGSSPAIEPGISLHRFPKPGRTNSLRCELWAQYCFPHESWASIEFQQKLYSQHKVLCSKHFIETCFVNQKLFRTAVPSKDSDEVPTAGPSEIREPLVENLTLMNITHNATKDATQQSKASSNVETSFGQCRCCLEEGHHRDITKVYSQNGLREVYGDMFLDCFNVFLSTNTNISTLICTSCVHQLRSARDFKKLVLQTERQLMDALQNCDDDQKGLVNVPVPKEIQMQEFEEPQTQTQCQPEISVDFAEEMPILASSLDERNDFASDANESNIEEEIVQSISLPKPKVLKTESKKREKMALIHNTFTLLENCNATLFKSKMRAGFPCFYCKDIFDNFEVLRQHQTEDHMRSNISKILKAYSAEKLVVYADVTDLKCTICDQFTSSLKELKSHLVEVHSKVFYSKVTDRVVPFKLYKNYFECQICMFNFETFGAAEKHTNTHFTNYVCHICGGGFVTMLRLKNHLYALHKEGTFPCEYCDKVFTTQLRHKSHVDLVHKMLKKIKCYKCSARFSDYFVHKKHMVEVHGELPIVYRCNVCSKAFSRRYILSFHMKRHLDQKDVECDLCTYTCYNKTELRKHIMLKHNKINKQNMERSFRCTICDKTYLRKKALREHIIRIHTGDRRFVCLVCSQEFVQSNSLETHMRNHHDYLKVDQEELI